MVKKLNSLLLSFPQKLKKNTLIFIILKSLGSVWFVEAVWFFYWARFANYLQIGIMFSVLTVVSILAEIPTGIFADKYGRKMAVNIGLICHIVGALLIFSAQNWIYLFVGGFIENIGRAFISGSLEALLYDDLKDHDKQQDYDLIISLTQQFSIFIYAVSVLIGGSLYIVYFRLPHFLMAVNFVIALIISYFLNEPKIIFKKLTSKVSRQDFFIGFSQLFSLKLKPYLLTIAVILILFFLYDWGFIKPAIAVNFGFFSQGQGIVYALISVINSFFIGFLPFIRKKLGDFFGLNFFLLLMISGYILSIFKLGIFGIFILLMIEASGNLAEPWISIVINKHIDSQHRATTLSTLQFFSRVPFLILNLIAGRLLDLKLINYFNLTIGLIFLCLWIFNMIKVTKYSNNFSD